jgi:predicted NBD/HSP70 family sugar kinase
LKRINQKRVYNYIYEVGKTSKLEIANALKISFPTVASSVNTLIEQGLVSNCGEYDSTGGRKAQIFCCNSLAKIAIGVEILKEGVQIVAIDLYGQILREDYNNIPFENSEDYYSKLGMWINSFVFNLPYPKKRNLGVCIALQGLISNDGETITYSEILKSTGVKRSSYQKYLDYPCTLVHDTEAAALAETWQRPEISDAVYIALNRNFGGTVILDGRIQRPFSIKSGVIEHMTIDPDGPLCYCGKRGCIETFCSANSLKETAQMDLAEFFEKIHSGDSRCIQIWEKYLGYLALSINNIRMVINCDFIIGGYLLQFMNKSDIELLTKLVTDRCSFKDYGIIQFKLGKYKDKAPKIGAAITLVIKYISAI